MVSRSVTPNNAAGIVANGTGATIWVGQSTVTGNTIGWESFSGVVLSAGDNTIEGNAANETAPPTYTKK